MGSTPSSYWIYSHWCYTKLLDYNWYDKIFDLDYYKNFVHEYQMVQVKKY